MIKYGIDIGHNCPPDTGAVGIKREDDLTLAVGSTVMAKLEALGYEVVDCKPKKVDTVKQSLEKRCQAANNAKVDIFVSIHFNSANSKAYGTEVYAISSAGVQIAQPVLSEIVKLGFNDRGVKQAKFYVLKNTIMPAILIECCFVDSQKDMDLFEVEPMANAIVKGLTGNLPSGN